MLVKSIFAGVFVIALASLCVAESSSENYTLQQCVIASAGVSSASGNHAAGSTAGQSTPIGESSAADTQLGAGF